MKTYQNKTFILKTMFLETVVMMVTFIFLLRQSIWVVLPQNPSDHQTLFVFGHVILNVTFSSMNEFMYPMIKIILWF